MRYSPCARKVYSADAIPTGLFLRLERRSASAKRIVNARKLNTCKLKCSLRESFSDRFSYVFTRSLNEYLCIDIDWLTVI